MTLWINRWWLVFGGVIGALAGGYSVISSYRYVSVQRIAIESRNSSYIQGLSSAMPGQNWGNGAFQEAQNSIRKLNQTEFFSEVAQILFSDREFITALTEDRSWIALRRLGLKRFLPQKVVKALNLGDVAWNVRSAIMFRVDEADGIEIRVTHQSPIVASKIANQAAKTGKDFIAKTSLNEIDQALEYVKLRVRETTEDIRSEDARAMDLTSSIGRSPDFDRVSAAEQQQLSQDILRSELEMQTNEIIMQALRGKISMSDAQAIEPGGYVTGQTALTFRIQELLASYEKREVLRVNGADSETFEMRTLNAAINRLESELAEMGVGRDTIANAASLVSGGLSLNELQKRNQVLKTQISVARKLLEVRVKDSQQAFNMNLSREAIARSRGVLFRNLEYLNSQRFDLELKKIAVTNKYSTNADESPAGAMRIPSVRNVMIFSVLTSIFIFAGLCIVLSFSDPLVISLSDIPGYQPSNRLGQVHSMSGRMIRSRSLSPRVVNDFKHSVQRILKLSRSRSDRILKSIAVSSSRSGEGKSFVSFHIAGGIARAGKRVLYIDGDLLASRFPWQNYKSQPIIYSSKYFDVFSGVHGLDLCRLRDMTYADFAKILHSESWSALSSSYDFIVIDLPPISLVPETVDVVRVMDMGIFVVASARHKTTIVSESFEMFAEHSKEAPMLLLNFSREFSLSSNIGHYGAYGSYLNSSANRETSFASSSSNSRRPAA